ETRDLVLVLVREQREIRARGRLTQLRAAGPDALLCGTDPLDGVLVAPRIVAVLIRGQELDAPRDDLFERLARRDTAFADAGKPLDLLRALGRVTAPIERELVLLDVATVKLERAIERSARHGQEPALKCEAEHQHVRADAVAEQIGGEPRRIERRDAVRAASSL